MLRTLGRLAQFGFVILEFGLRSIFKIDPIDRRIQRQARKLLGVFDLKLEISGSSAPLIPGSLIVSNHLSYLDVVVLAALAPSRFVTSREIEKTFFLGTICRWAACVFVERRSPARLRGDLENLKQVLLKGESVVAFPEATSSAGVTVLPFRPGLFGTPSTVPVRPITIRYLGPESALVPYYGDATFLPHLWKLLSVSEPLRCKVEIHPALRGASSSRESAKLAHELVLEAYSSSA